MYSRISAASTAALLVATFIPLTAQAITATATDDTGLVDPGSVEVGVFAAMESRDSGDSYELPGVSVEFGLVENWSIAVGGNRQVEDPSGESSSSGWGNAGIELRWRAFAADGLTLVFAPNYSTAIKSSSTRRGLVEDVDIFSLPAILSYERGKWIFNGQLSYDLTSTSTNGIFYGFWTGYQLGPVLVMGEIYGEELSGSEESATNARLAFDWEFMEATSLLFSVGTGLTDDLPEEDELDFEAFLGWRAGF